MTDPNTPINSFAHRPASAPTSAGTSDAEPSTTPSTTEVFISDLWPDGESVVRDQINPDLVVAYLDKAHGGRAGEEALMRALIKERSKERSSARFWLNIYDRILEVG